MGEEYAKRRCIYTQKGIIMKAKANDYGKG